MLVTYVYRTGIAAPIGSKNQHKLHGPYQCELEDFRKFFDYVKHGRAGRDTVSEIWLYKPDCEDFYWRRNVGWVTY